MKQQGFTLIEILIACAIVAIIAAASTSSFSLMIEQSRKNKDISRLLLIIRSTRQNSVNSSTTTVLCPTLDKKNCQRNWKLPLIVFSDLNKNKKRDDNEAILNQYPSFSEADIRIKYPKSQIRFNEKGMANYYNGTLAYCLNDATAGIIISRIGRIRFAQDLDGDHIPDVNSSTSVSCE